MYCTHAISAVPCSSTIPSRYWEAVSKGYGELRYICPSIFVNEVQANLSVPNWNYRWNVVDPELAKEGKLIEQRDPNYGSN